MFDFGSQWTFSVKPDVTSGVGVPLNSIQLEPCLDGISVCDEAYCNVILAPVEDEPVLTRTGSICWSSSDFSMPKPREPAPKLKTWESPLEEFKVALERDDTATREFRDKFDKYTIATENAAKSLNAMTKLLNTTYYQSRGMCKKFQAVVMGDDISKRDFEVLLDTHAGLKLRRVYRHWLTASQDAEKLFGDLINDLVNKPELEDFRARFESIGRTVHESANST